jgi:hypothetical protein
MLDPMTMYRVSGPFPVTGVQPGGLVDGTGIDDVELLIAAGIITPVQESDKPSKADKAGDK